MSIYKKYWWLFSGGERPLIFTIDTTKAGSASDTFVLPLAAGTVNIDISWGDGSFETINTSGDKTHVYSASGIYEIRITGTMSNIDFDGALDELKMKELKQWGDVALVNYHVFRSCSNLTFSYNTGDEPKVPSVGTLTASHIFNSTQFGSSDISWFNKYGNVGIGISAFQGLTRTHPSWGSLSFENMTNCGTMLRFGTFDFNIGSSQLFASSCNASSMFESNGMSTANYTDTLVGWANQIYTDGAPINVNFSSQTGRTFDTSRSGGANFANAGAARTYLTTATGSGGAGWTISGDTVI